MNDIIKKLEKINQDICSCMDISSSKAAKAMALLKLFEETKLHWRLQEVINDMEYKDKFVDVKDERIQKYQQILSIVMQDCQPRG